jgi:tRNA threonylcarbamoyladenosine biosynthesis protein TsaE
MQHVTWRVLSKTPEYTEQLAEKIGGSLRGGEVIELVSDLGGGKTTFVRGLVRGLGSEDKVASPTFTISKLYRTAQLEVHHFDFYRLHEAGIIADELAEVACDPDVVTVVEWAEVVKHVLPEGRLTITITQTPEGNRDIVFEAPAALDYLVEAAKQ